MRAVILAGGKGRRLLPYTTVIPKPLMPIGERPILDFIIRQLKNSGFSHITMAVGYLAELIQTYFGDGSKYGLKIDYSREESPLGTIGSLSLIEGLEETFLVMNGDVLTNMEYGELINYHAENKAVTTIATFEKEVKIDLGILEQNDQMELTQYIEKPTFKYKVSMGVYVFNREILQFIQPNTYLDFPDLVVTLIKAGKKVMGFPFKGYWLDIGRPEDYTRALDEFDTKNEFKIVKERLNIE